MKTITSTEFKSKLDAMVERAESQASSSSPEAGSALTVTREEYESLLKDKARLDYLEQAHVALNAHYKTEYGWRLIINPNVVRFMAGNSCPRDDGYPGIDLHDSQGGNAKLPTCREAIDACMPNSDSQTKV